MRIQRKEGLSMDFFLICCRKALFLFIGIFLSQITRSNNKKKLHMFWYDENKTSFYKSTVIAWKVLQDYLKALLAVLCVEYAGKIF